MKSQKRSRAEEVRDHKAQKARGGRGEAIAYHGQTTRYKERDS